MVQPAVLAFHSDPEADDASADRISTMCMVVGRDTTGSPKDYVLMLRRNLEGEELSVRQIEASVAAIREDFDVKLQERSS